MAVETVAVPHKSGRSLLSRAPATKERIAKGNLTTQTEFRDMPAHGCRLFVVSPGIEIGLASREAADLIDAVSFLLGQSVETGANGKIAYLCEFALEAANALITSMKHHD